ncbi:coiled-coil domain-containing protein 159 isoform X1 [Marmota marmota marmota]|uniref:coiled-coil domain-containing protein 159 isoform X1 n=1 Tax=Marmota marmota marmota TaxID=9994 RepID=UPI002093DD70|nr:coiled-coil domain-containing protein 159 isoform X1 [Marmota marmota marmota]XP_048651529.1 coiled-coil domain-containing protein 159 isoform X1 [Marmota marmota marmota]XP_048651530.1 coiled-coil domain-containing protein 159 isoform X1 [Marmota marmota marmota]
MNSDPLLAGLPLDQDYSVPPHSPSHSSSNVCLPAYGKWSSSDKAVDCRSYWTRTTEPETLEPTASEDTVRIIDWKPGWGSGPQPHGAPSISNPDQQEHCNDQDLLKRHQNTAKVTPPRKPLQSRKTLQYTSVGLREGVMGQGDLQGYSSYTCSAPRTASSSHQDLHNKPLETNSSKVKAKSTMMIPDSQKLLRCELESLKSQLQAQTKAFEFLNHSVTMLEKESCLQQIKIQQLEEVLSPVGRQGEKEGQKWDTEQGRQELYGALAQGLRGLQKTLRDSEEVQRVRTTRCLQLLAQEIRDSKKFLWEELELVREEVTFIYQKLQAQEEEIAQNLVNIQKMQKTQVKCRKVLTKMKQQGFDPSAWPETEEVPLGGNGCWKDDLQKELSDIWSAVHGLQNSIDGLTMSSGVHPRASSLRGHNGHRCLSPPLPSWDSDSDSDKPQFGKSRSFPHD